MIKYFRRQFNFSCFLADVAALVLSFLTAYLLRHDILPELSRTLASRPMFPFRDYFPIFLLCSLTMLVVLFIVKAYHAKIGSPLLQLFFINLKGVIGAFIVTLSLAYLLRLIFLSRTFLFLFAFAFLVFSTLFKYLVSQWFRKGLRKGRLFKAAVLVGANERARRLAEILTSKPELGLRVKGYVAVAGDHDAAEAAALKNLGAGKLGEVSELTEIVEREVVDGVIFCVGIGALGDMEDLFLACEDLGVDALMAANVFPHLNAQVHLERLEETALLRFTTVPHNQTALFLKRSFDVVASFSGLLFLSPLFLVVSLLIKLTSRGPVLFKQIRMGLNGRLFSCLKFRTMVADAEKLQDKLKNMNEADGPVFKMKNDPRITPLGRIFRKLSIDELPQLWNVLMGEMSLVGPRPPIPSEVGNYERWQRRRLSMRPGITCLWQISGRSELDFDTWMKLDLKYIDQWSLVLDFIILLKTIPAVLTTRGAA